MMIDRLPRFALALGAVATAAACASTPKPATVPAAAPVAAAPVSPPPPPPAIVEAPLPPPPIEDRREVYAAPGAGSNWGGPGAMAEAAPSEEARSLAALGDRVFFETDQFSLTAEAQQVLARQAAWLTANPGIRVLLAGNCDERGTREYNLALGARRASAARDYLISLGVAASRIETVSYGKERPIDDRPNPEGWAVNRNAHTSPVRGVSS